jgi:hypothetical protein
MSGRSTAKVRALAERRKRNTKIKDSAVAQRFAEVLRKLTACRF